MTHEKFEQAKNLEERIRHITSLIEALSSYEYKLKPPTRQSNYTLWRNAEREVTLNEGEAVFLRKALQEEKSRLEQEFGKL